MRGAVFGAMALLIAVAQPAYAADPATLGCVMQTLDPAARVIVEDDARFRFGGGGKDATSEQMEGVRQAARDCAKRHGWSTEAWEAASIHTAAQVSIQVATPILSKAGIKVDRLIALFDALPAKIREESLGKPRGETPSEFVEMMDKGLAEGVFTMDEAQMGLLGEFFGMLLVRDYSRAQFLRS